MIRVAAIAVGANKWKVISCFVREVNITEPAPKETNSLEINEAGCHESQSQYSFFDCTSDSYTSRIVISTSGSEW
jgi:hypothetical protein